MGRKQLTSWVILFAVFAAASAALALFVDVTIEDRAGVVLALPARIGDWKGEEIRQCLSPSCDAVVVESEWKDPAVCPRCGGVLDPMDAIEKGQLPPDTEMLRKRYVRADGRWALVAIILSGRERASIHRPEQCLTGGGVTLSGDEIVSVPLPGRDPLQVKLFALETKSRTTDGRVGVSGSYYAYWFVGNRRETPHDWQRQLWLATDRIFHNRGHRWAYISLSGPRDPSNRQHVAEIREIIAALYPQITRPGA